MDEEYTRIFQSADIDCALKLGKQIQFRIKSEARAEDWREHQANACHDSEVISYVTIDNLLTQNPVTEFNLHVLKLCITDIGHRSYQRTHKYHRQQEITARVAPTESLHRPLKSKSISLIAAERMCADTNLKMVILTGYPSEDGGCQLREGKKCSMGTKTFCI